MPRFYNRREVLTRAAALTVLASLPQTLLARIPTENPPLSDFGSETTAEEVTAGLDLSGMTFAVTGANSGLGYETMRVLAMRGAHVLGIARTMEKAENACNSVAGQTTPFALDLADFPSIVSASDAIRETGLALDGLICNAGIMALPELQQVNGLERHFVVNHLGHFILINQLRDRVEAAPQGRFVILSSAAHKSAPEAGIEFDNLSGERGYEPWKSYGHSKLANALCALELARQLEGSTATANSLHPGVINTNLGRHMSWWMRLAASLVGWTFMKSVEAGAATSCYVATHPDLAKVSGHYFSDCNVAPEGGYLEDADMAAKLWAVSEDLTREYLRS